MGTWNSIPQLARDRQAISAIESVVQCLKTNHDLIVGGCGAVLALPDRSIALGRHLPALYWTLKRYNEHVEQLGHLGDYDEFIAASMSSGSYSDYVSGGRLVVNVGDVCLSAYEE